MSTTTTTSSNSAATSGPAATSTATTAPAMLGREVGQTCQGSEQPRFVWEWRIEEKRTWRQAWQGWGLWGQRLQASRVHRVDRHIGSISSVDGGIELRLSFRGKWKAFGEKNQRLAARDRAQASRDVADGQKE
jgi:hypothetical protein